MDFILKGVLKIGTLFNFKEEDSKKNKTPTISLIKLYKITA